MELVTVNERVFTPLPSDDCYLPIGSIPRRPEGIACTESEVETLAILTLSTPDERPIHQPKYLFTPLWQCLADVEGAKDQLVEQHQREWHEIEEQHTQHAQHNDDRRR